MRLPDYLNDIEIEKTRAPATEVEKDLPFDLLEPRIFERFCCELVYKKAEFELGVDVVDVLPIGTSGQTQHGADIFVKANSDASEEVILYEVKRVKSFTIAEYKKAVDRFLQHYESWGFEVAEFNLFVAEDISADEIALWQSEASKLSDRSVTYRVIPSATLNRWVKNFPELVYKYFHPAWTELLFGKVGVWHLENYGVWDYKESASWSGYAGPEKNLYGDNLTYINDHVKIYAFLPSVEKNSASCQVEFRNGRFSHVTITLGHGQLVRTFFTRAKVPVPESIRPFLLESTFEDGYFCDIGNCRIKLSLGEVKCLCVAFDIFWEEYKKRVNDIEEAWRSKFFNYHTGSSTDVPLMKIKRGLWSLLLDFAENHDAFNTEGDWSLFDSCPGWLKIYTRRPSKSMEVGYHAFVKPKKYDGIFTNFRSVDDDVVLAWQPPNDFVISAKGTIINPRYYWDAETTHDWLKHSLIPRALKWRGNRKINRNRFGFRDKLFFAPKNKSSDNYNPDDYLVSFYEPHTDREIDAIEDIDGLLSLVNRLQTFFNSGPKDIFVNLEAYKNLYGALGEVLSKSDINNFSYLHGNLNYLPAKDVQSLIESVKKHSSDTKDGCDNAFRIDCVLRCIQVAVRDGKSYLNNYEIRHVVGNLRQLAEIMEDRKLLFRQSRFIE